MPTTELMMVHHSLAPEAITEETEQSATVAIPSPRKDPHAKTRLLLTLWDLGGADGESKKVKKSELTGKVKRKRKGKKIGNYQGTYEELEREGAIAIKMEDRVPQVYLTDKGKEMLAEGLKSPEFEFEGSVVASRLANGLLSWIRQASATTHSFNSNGHSVVSETKIAAETITSYEAFKPAALEVYDRLNREYNLDDLVPIYRIRREIGEKVSRSQFNEWMLEMQGNDLLQLIGGDMTNITPDKIADSIKTELGALRYYAQRL